MMLTNEEKRAYAERTIAELDLLWLSLWRDLVTEIHDPAEQLLACQLLLQICERRGWWRQKWLEWRNNVL